ncbi:MAG TPA: PEGA domain-containing protein [Vicinamibacterales bacterium]|nr:PEGA domain-containing protein [Vicinamibacterales bacterium]
MTSVPAPANQPEAPLFTDGLGDRVVAVDAATGDLLQILRVRPQLLAVPSFEFALRERAARLANFRHAYYARVRRIDRHPSGLAIVSDHVEGVRLSEMLRVAHERGLQLDLNAALCLLRQVVPSIALLHENARDVAHGLIGPERLIVTPRARVIVVEHVLGSAVEQLQYNRERLWQDLRAAAPAPVGVSRFDHRADVMAIGMTALALVLGRPIAASEYPHRLGSLLNEARGRTAGAEDQPLPDALHNWIARALQLDVRQGFQSATEAQVALEDALLSEDSSFVAAPIALETFLSRYIAVMLDPIPAAAPIAAPAIAIVPSAPMAPRPPAPVPVATMPPPAAAWPMPGQAPVPVAAMTPPAPAPVWTMPAAAPVPVATMPPPAPMAAPPPPPVRVAVVDSTPAPATPFAARPEHAPIARTEAAAEPVKATPRDITELLRDFDLPPAPSTVAALAQNERLEAGAAPVPVSRFSLGRGATRWRRLALAALVVVAVGEGAVIASRSMAKAPPPRLGTLSLQTNPPGVAVFIDGVARGNTPARISLDAGSHIVELRGRGVPRVIPVTVTAGAEASQYLELPETPSAGSLLVQSDPAGAKVTIDGVDHGIAPVSVADLAPGDHEVVLQADGGPAVRQRVVIQAGVTSSVLAPVSTATAGPVSGWLSVKSAVAIDVRENGRLIGNTDADRIMMAAGRHDVELVNETLGYRVTRSIQVPPGKVMSLSIEMPQGVLNVNASPWAEVWIDGRRVGETPIGNLPMSIGPHEVVFRHPQLGEKRQAVSVTLKAPVRLSVEMK